MSILCEPRAQNIAEIVAEWKRLTNREPWCSLPDSEWVDHLPPLLNAMFDATVCGRGSHDGRRRVIEAAMQHGEQRRSHGLPLDVLLEEHNELRTAVWQFLSRRGVGAQIDDSLGEIIRFDAAATFAAMGSLRGYHRREIERERNWEGEIAQIVVDWEQTSLTGDETASID
jgi:hypothetical protein